MRIGFIGLGNMGAPMAQGLAAAGHAVLGFDTVKDAPEGVTQVASTAEAAMGAEVVILMLPDGAAVAEVAARLLPGMAAGALLVDCSTIDVDTARKVAETARSHGIAFVDAPVSGGMAGARAGTLTFMAGGETADFARLIPLFDIMGAHAHYCGPAGSGQAAKICNNMILGATMAATCEAIALADGLGLGRQELFNVVSTASGQSWSLTAYCPMPGVGPTSPADNDYAPGFASELMLKDLRLALSAAETARADTPMARRAAEIYAQFVEDSGGRGQDFSALLRHYAQRTGS